MGRKALLFAFTILSIFIFTTGCRSSNPDASSSQDEYSPSNDAPAAPASSNVMVINDTLVDVFKEPNTAAERVTQAIFNQPVTVLGEEENWTNVSVIDGYTGWVKSKYLTGAYSGDSKQPGKFRLIVTAKTETVFTGVDSNIAAAYVVMGTELPLKSTAEGWYEVVLPGKKTGWIKESGSFKVPLNTHIPKTSANDFVMTAKKFLGSTYLWGGISSYGMDCSGLVYISARVNGVDLPRDTSQQINYGEKIDDVQSMIPGDLVFFSSDESRSDVSHVGIYIGNNQYINASSSKGSVYIRTTEDSFFAAKLVGIRRIF